ncbi:MAG: hypothetical protein EZS28_035720 [Streblomastix strix]|uniref:Uncharacterized protein n=1 Tax=Streblomastix strix TaxID=222440 RepID=A0A5J4UF48_9EUKA|nr:MAG: hypothetical protein EZS28_035720 [Streblomastix strix]
MTYWCSYCAEHKSWQRSDYFPKAPISRSNIADIDELQTEKKMIISRSKRHISGNYAFNIIDRAVFHNFTCEQLRTISSYAPQASDRQHQSKQNCLRSKSQGDIVFVVFDVEASAFTAALENIKDYSSDESGPDDDENFNLEEFRCRDTIGRLPQSLKQRKLLKFLEINHIQQRLCIYQIR